MGNVLLGGIAVAIRNLHSLGETKSSSRHRSFLSLAVLALAGVALHALVDFPLQIASLQLYVVTYLGVCWGSNGWRKRESYRAGGCSGDCTLLSPKVKKFAGLSVPVGVVMAPPAR